MNSKKKSLDLEPYMEMLGDVAGQMTDKQVQAIVFQCAGSGKIPSDDLEKVKTGFQLMTALQTFRLINPSLNEWDFLITLLRSKGGAGNKVLAKKVEEFEASEKKRREANKKTAKPLPIVIGKSAANLVPGLRTASPPVDKPTLRRTAAVKYKSQESRTDDQLQSPQSPLKDAGDAHFISLVNDPNWTFYQHLADGETSIIYKGRSAKKVTSPTAKRGDLDALPAQEVVGKLFRRNGALRDEKSFLRQVQVLRDLETHENIVRLVAELLDTSPPCAILELAPFGDVRSFLRAPDHTGVTVHRLLNFAQQVANGMSHIENSGFIHGNLRASNVLLFDCDVVKISGFSLARDSELDDCSLADNIMLPIRWLALDVILYRQFNMRSDVWSFAIFVVELLTFGEEPYKDIESSEKLVGELRRGFRHPMPDNCPRPFYDDVLQPCWQLKSDARPSFDWLVSVIDGHMRLQTQMPRYTTNSGSEDSHSSSTFTPLVRLRSDGSLGRRDLTNTNRQRSLKNRSNRNTLLPSVAEDQSDYLITSDMQTIWKRRSWQVEPTSVFRLELIGSGEFGDVWKGRMNNGLEVAVKTFKAHNIDPETFVKEANFMVDLLPHPRIVQMFGICTKPGSDMFIITELIPLGDLRNFLRNDQGDKIQLVDLVRYAVQIADAMSYIESINAIHRDIAARNVLVADNGNNVKLSDFGLARFLVDSEYKVLRPDAPMPVRWTAPEAIRTRTFTIKSDVWAYGIFLVELVTYGEIPYPEMHKEEVIEAVKKGHRHPQPANCPDSIYELMIRCWRREEVDRPSFQELHRVMTEMHDVMRNIGQLPPATSLVKRIDRRVTLF